MSNDNTNSENFNWDSIEETFPFVIFELENKFRVKVRTLGDPKIVSRDYEENGKFKDQFDFPVIDMVDNVRKTLSVSSARLMLKLKALLPLEDKELDIQRTGEGYETDYTVKVL